MLFRDLLRAVCVFALVGVLTQLGVACSDDAGEAIKGSSPGTERWVVLFEGDAPDLTDYKKAQATGKGLAAAEAKLRADAQTRHKGFEKGLKELEGKVVERWWMTNAVTVELPSGNVGSLQHMDGVAEVKPDTLVE